jgi:hypothetical protein
MKLNDQTIRAALKNKLSCQAQKPKAIVDELSVCNGNAIADVVALYNEAHCYEIKGVTDKIERIIVQGQYYNSSFRKITLVTTENHLSKALAICPKHWGIIVAFSTDNTNVRFRHIQGAKPNPSFCKKAASLTLWKSEMLSLVNEQRYKRKPRDFLAQLISTSKKKVELSNSICNLLVSRQLDKVVC